MGRTVRLDKAEDFLKGYSCLIDNEEGNMPQIPDGADVESESIPEENMDTTVESVDDQEAKNDNSVDISLQLAQKYKLKIDIDFVKSHSNRCKFRKRPAH